VIFRDVGVLGTGLWEGEVVDNDALAARLPASKSVQDPFRGRRADDGAIRVAGLELTPETFPRTLAALRESFADPFRGARRRRFFPPELLASSAEAEAAQKALDDAGLAATDVGAILVQSFLPDGLQPKNAALVAHALGVVGAPAWEVDSICNSALSQLSVAASLVTSGFARHVLCVQSAAYSRVSDPGSSSTVQEGDMASAFVVGPSPGARLALSWRTDGRLHGAIKLAWRAPAGAPPRRAWEPAPERLLISFDPALQEEVMGEIATNARTVCFEALARAELAPGEVDLFIAHQPMSYNRVLMEEVLGLREGVAFDTFEEYASINSCGIPASIHEARRGGQIERGQRVLLFGPAAGYTYAAAAMRW
jgi:3-oxoacyl-[acyl-carrier-protein] synthase III